MPTRTLQHRAMGAVAIPAVDVVVLAAGPSLNGVYFTTAVLAMIPPMLIGQGTGVGFIVSAEVRGESVVARIELPHPLARIDNASVHLNLTGTTRLAEREGKLWRVVEQVAEVNAVSVILETFIGSGEPSEEGA